MPSFSSSTLLLSFALLLVLAHPAYAFGAGNIASVSKIEGINWRHGDIEDTLLTLVMSRACGGKKFDKMTIQRIYFGNWLRDYSQAIDVGTVKYVSAEAIRILLWVLGFMTFGYGTREFEVTAERLGCYRPEDHIDNPKDYADNLDASQFDHRLRGPVDEEIELAIDPQTGMKNYIANEHAGIMTSALHVRKLFRESIRLGRSYARSHNKDELYEALRLLGTGLHCLEDYSAHSNYTELALIEMGERDVFPHVGRRTRINLQGAQHSVYPIITGTFGGVDFLHSVMGEFDDKATQSEIQGLEGTMQEGSQGNNSVLKDLLSSVPSGLFGDKDQAGKADELQANASAAQESQEHVSPRDPEAFTEKMQNVAKEIYPIIQWHDETMQQIREAIEKIPILPDLIENIEEQINIFVFSLLAPFVLPIIGQIKTELNTGSSEVIQSSKDKQLIVFNDDHSSDPTHSMLSKDHFSNVLNEVAGRIASQVLKWAVPQLISCWDDESIDPERTIDRIIHGVFHHPALRNYGDDGASDGRQLMFRVVEEWWRNKDGDEQDELRRKLSREGVEEGENHLEGVHDTGHGCGAPLKMSKSGPDMSSNPLANEMMGGLASAMGGNGGSSGLGGQSSAGISKFAEEAVGGGALGGIFGALAGGVGGSLLSGFLGGGKEEARSTEGYNSQGNYEQSYTEIGHSGDRYAQAEYTQEQLPNGGRRTDYQQYGQQGGQGAGFEQISEQRRSYGGGYEETNERIYERPDGRVETETWREGETADGRHYHEAEHHREERSGSDGDSDNSERRRHGKHHRKHHNRRGSGSNEGSDRPQEYVPEREERRERFEEPPRQEYGGYGQQREQGGFGGLAERFGGMGFGGGGGDHGNEGGWGEREREGEGEREEEYQEERREERREGHGWGF
ncbi:NIMA-interacting protein TinC [Sclerotinia borealis F-4128]|uniref:NIMA-interacting protein TinC n=1 Tax=Sclerotinia borealis (strain F-4128) TaxID=1432307 RepID=W9CT51_SCLBF|nr:NIMA-interacting protein TinC [Sclerotinia borealis F-4128]